MFATPGAADLERNVLNHYNLQSVYPTEWPTELDESNDEDEDSKVGVRRSRSRYSALERAASDRRTLIPGSQQTHDGRANLVQKDEPDPLGGPRSVITSLRQSGLPIEQDIRLRNRFLLSSTTFSPAYLLSQTHSDASTADLVEGLRYLERSIDQKSASLKVLVETNFERFVRAKATIDNVYTEMRNQGIDQPPAGGGPPSPRGLRHSRQVSRQSGLHQRITSTGSTAPPPQPSKNALRKETEYGVKGIKGPLIEVSQKAEDVWGPALEGREREASLKAVAEAVQKDRYLYELGGELSLAAQQKNYEQVVDVYNQARTRAHDAARLGDKAMQTGQPLTNDQVHTLLVTGRMWADVQEQVKNLKRDIWRRLSNLQTIYPTSNSNQGDEHAELIGILLELGVEDNPIWVWLLSRYDNLKNKITAVAERSRMEIEVLRRRLAATAPPSPDIAASYLRSAVRETSDSTDNEQVLDFWRTVSTYVNKLLSPTNGLLGEIAAFWETAKSYIDGSKETSLPAGFNGESKRHHRLSDAGVRGLSNGAAELVNLVHDALRTLFAESPTEDISSLFSPLTNGTPTPMTPMFSPSEGRLGNLDEKNMPPPPTKTGDIWDDFAFWPPHSNAMSALQYLSEMLAVLASGVGGMMAIDPVSRNGSLCDKIKTLVSVTRERCLTVTCIAWGKDSENCRQLEDWLRSSDKRNNTRLPGYVSYYERTILNRLQQILYFSESVKKPAARSLISPPTPRSMQLVRQQFVESIFTILKGMVQNSEQTATPEISEWTMVPESINNSSADSTTDTASYSIDASNHNVRLLLTMSNVKSLQSEYVPQLIHLFEELFNVRLTDESKQINDKFIEIDRQLFQSYTNPTITYITQLIKNGINSPTWEPKTTRPDQVSPHVYASLMVLVNIHTEVSTTVSHPNTSNNTSNLVNEVLSHFFETTSQALLNGFKERTQNRYSLAALIQATLDTEFIAQTLSQYTSKRVGEIQNEIYVELDKRTTNDARSDLQKELGVMRGVLKKLREDSRNSFGCFKRARGGEKDRGRGEGNLQLQQQ